jgi:hypothetical protein
MNDAILRRQVLTLLDGGRAHARARDVLARFPKRRCGERPPGFAHSAWQLLEHLRIAQRDILDFCMEARHRSPEWPDGYWPKSAAPRNAAAWDASARAFLGDLRACVALVRGRNIDLLADLPHVEGVTWLQELFLVADHNSWHLGQLLQLRRVLEAEAG